MTYKFGYERQMLTYFETAQAPEYPTFSEFAVRLGTVPEDIERWKERHPAFRAAYDACRARQEALLVSGALAKKYDPTFAKFLLTTKFGYGEETDTGGEFSVNIRVEDG